MRPEHAANRRHWDELVALHVGSRFYDVPGFLAGRSTVGPVERAALGSLTRRSLLHLQCHFGLDTLSLLRAGAARVTGVDFSAPALAEARRLAAALKLDAWAEFVAADVLELDLGRRFDRVFTSLGAINWLADLDAWGRVVARHLAPDGVFYMLEIHPAALMLDQAPDGRLMHRYDYFHGAEPLTLTDVADYAEPAYRPQAPGQGWTWSLADVAGALERAGLTVFELAEHPFTAWPMFDGLVRDPDGYYWRRAAAPHLPLLFSLKARPA